MIFNDSVFDSFPIMETERLRLREITMEDVSEVFSIYSDPVAMNYFGRLPYKSISEAEERIDKTRIAFENKEGIRWAITQKPDNTLIGSAGIWRLDKSNFRGEIGYELSPAFWRKGIMHEALKKIIDFG